MREGAPLAPPRRVVQRRQYYLLTPWPINRRDSAGRGGRTLWLVGRGLYVGDAGLRRRNVHLRRGYRVFGAGDAAARDRDLRIVALAHGCGQGTIGCRQLFFCSDQLFLSLRD